MTLEECYMKCGLKQPNEFKRDLYDSTYFTDREIMRDVFTKGRRNGTTTNYVIQAIHNLLNGKTTVIWCGGIVTTKLTSRAVASYLGFFDELKSWKHTSPNGSYVNQFDGTTLNRNRIYVSSIYYETIVRHNDANIIYRDYNEEKHK